MEGMTNKESLFNDRSSRVLRRKRRRRTPTAGVGVSTGRMIVKKKKVLSTKHRKLKLWGRGRFLVASSEAADGRWSWLQITAATFLPERC